MRRKASQSSAPARKPPSNTARATKTATPAWACTATPGAATPSWACTATPGAATPAWACTVTPGGALQLNMETINRAHIHSLPRLQEPTHITRLIKNCKPFCQQAITHQ
ncbi:hypothetical protein OS493_020559 [Desmophyllum pertusum]|uniref:Uncharacterized protein n=1 Tax=Desmophyllum pertusum TaxID=174260 RepID=A0A9X0CSR6_9CNID|nr:hypothetical protein OS493_020559 [Desmophyllum pertusum]